MKMRPVLMISMCCSGLFCFGLGNPYALVQGGSSGGVNVVNGTSNGQNVMSPGGYSNVSNDQRAQAMEAVSEPVATTAAAPAVTTAIPQNNAPQFQYTQATPLKTATVSNVDTSAPPTPVPLPIYRAGNNGSVNPTAAPALYRQSSGSGYAAPNVGMGAATTMSSTPAGGGSANFPASTLPTTPVAETLLAAVQNVNANVQKTNQLTLDRWQKEENAGDVLAPASTNFIWKQSGYQKLYNINTLPPASSTKGVNNGPVNTNSGKSMISRLMEEQAVPSLQTGQNSPSTQSGYYASSIVGSAAFDIDFSSMTDSVDYIIGDLYKLNQAPSNGSESTMVAFKKAVDMPFENKKDKSTGETWFDEMSTASTPQLLRVIAVQLAVSNELQYQSLKQQTNIALMQAIIAGQLGQIQVRMKSASIDNDTQAARLQQMIQRLLDEQKK